MMTMKVTVEVKTSKHWKIAVDQGASNGNRKRTN